MCFFGGGGSVSSQPAQQLVVRSDGGLALVEQGVPTDFVNRGATTVAQYQQMAAQDLSDRQIQSQQQIANQQQQFNEQQVQQQQQQYEQQQRQVQEQADRQTQYDTGRAQALGQGQQSVDTAFSRFSPQYFQNYANDYLNRAQDQIDYQRRFATRDLGFDLARRGVSSSQSGINQAGLLAETAGRARAEQGDLAQNAAADLQNRVANARQNLANQLVSAQSIGSPIAGSTIEDVNSALQTQRNAISPISASAGDVASNLQAVPVVNPLGSIFSGIVQGGSSFLGGLNQGSTLARFDAGLAGTTPFGGTSVTNRRV